MLTTLATICCAAFWRRCGQACFDVDCPPPPPRAHDQIFPWKSKKSFSGGGGLVLTLICQSVFALNVKVPQRADSRTQGRPPYKILLEGICPHIDRHLVGAAQCGVVAQFNSVSTPPSPAQANLCPPRPPPDPVPHVRLGIDVLGQPSPVDVAPLSGKRLSKPFRWSQLRHTVVWEHVTTTVAHDELGKGACCATCVKALCARKLVARRGPTELGNHLKMGGGGHWRSTRQGNEIGLFDPLSIIMGVSRKSFRF